MLPTTEHTRSLRSRRGRAPRPRVHPAQTTPWIVATEPVLLSRERGARRTPSTSSAAPRSPLPSSGDTASRRPGRGDTPEGRRGTATGPKRNREALPGQGPAQPAGTGRRDARGPAGLRPRRRVPPSAVQARTGAPSQRAAPGSAPGRAACRAQPRTAEEAGGTQGRTGAGPGPTGLSGPPHSPSPPTPPSWIHVSGRTSAEAARGWLRGLSPWRQRPRPAGAGPGDGAPRCRCRWRRGRTEPCPAAGRSGSGAAGQVPSGSAALRSRPGKGQPAPPSLLRAAAFALRAGATPRAPRSVRALGWRGREDRNGPARSLWYDPSGTRARPSLRACSEPPAEPHPRPPPPGLGNVRKGRKMRGL